MNRGWRWTLLLGLAGIASIALLVRTSPPVAPRATRFSLRGVDVSHHQGAIDWPAVAKEPNLTFAWIKATEGGDFTDPRFAENFAQAQRAGLRVGAYHFFTFCRASRDQADHFLAVVPRIEMGMPAAVDVELEGNCSARPSRAVLLHDLDVWLDAVELSTSKRPIVYATREVYDAYFVGSPLRAALWIRDLDGEPNAPWTFWQFDDHASVSGVDGPVDIDAFWGDRETLNRL